MDYIRLCMVIAVDFPAPCDVMRSRDEYNVQNIDTI